MGICMARCSGVRYQELEPGPPPRFSTLSFDQQHCTVCYEPDAKLPLSPPTIGCTHLADVCTSCLETYVCTNIKDGILRIKCASMLCREQMDIDEVLQASLAKNHRETFEKFCELKLRRNLDAEPGVVWCKAPGCSSAQIHIGGGTFSVNYSIILALTVGGFHQLNILWLSVTSVPREHVLRTIPPGMKENHAKSLLTSSSGRQSGDERPGRMRNG
ncbi:hypothetical protein FRC08_000612 [Ceratobasidium sp. 394]|nr:hypothetical protein FRC08_000612 [Ceratobasidium sp. 394]